MLEYMDITCNVNLNSANIIDVRAEWLPEKIFTACFLLDFT